MYSASSTSKLLPCAISETCYNPALAGPASQPHNADQAGSMGFYGNEY